MSLIDTIRRIKANKEKEQVFDYLKNAVPGAALPAAAGIPGLNMTPAVTPPIMKAQPQKEQIGFIEEGARGLARAPYQAGSQILDMTAFLTGVPEFAKASEKVLKESERAYPSTAPSLSTYDDFANASLSDIARYGVANIGQVAASAASMAIPGMAVQKIAAPIVAATKFSPALTKLVNYLGGAETAAQYIAGFSGSTLLEAGAIAGEAARETGVMPERLRTLMWAIPAGALESIEPMRLLTRFAAKVPRGVAEEAAKRTGKGIAKFIFDYAKEMGIEGGTEFIQTLIEEAGVKNVTGKMEAGQAIDSTLSDPDAYVRAGAAAVSGAFGAGATNTMVDTARMFKADPTPETETNNKPTDVVLKRVLNPKPPAQESLSEGPKADETLSERIKSVKKTVDNQADIGDNASKEDIQILKMRKQVSSVWEGVGVNESDMDNLSESLFAGKKYQDLSADELQQLYEVGVDQVAKGNVMGEMSIPEIMKPTAAPAPQPTMQPMAPAMNLQDAISRVKMPPPQTAMIQPGMNVGAMQMPRQPMQISSEYAAPPMEQPQAQPQPIKSTGKKTKLHTPSGKTLDAEVAAISVDDIVTSDMPGFPQEFQPRDRSSVESQNQIDSIAENPIIEKLITDYPDADTGAPVVVEYKDNQGNVKYLALSGNGRLMAAKRGYQRGTWNKYNQALQSKAGEFDIKQVPEKAAFVRVLKGNFSNKELAALAIDMNAEDKLAFTAKETANVDSDAVVSSADLINSYDLYSSQNRDFLRTFFNKTTNKNDVGRYVDANGQITKDGKAKLERALFAAAYGDGNISAKFAEDSDPNVANIINGMLAAAPGIAASKAKASRNELHDLSISSATAEAAGLLSSLRAQGMTVEGYFAQGQLFDDGVSLLAKDLLVLMDKYKRSAKKVAELLSGYNDIHIKLGDPRQSGFDLKTIPTRAEILKTIADRMEQKNEKQIGLFDSPTGSSGETKQNDGMERQERQQEEIKPEPEPAPAPAGYGANNTIVTTARYEELKKKFLSKTKNITSGIDPELATITAEMAAYHIEAGVRKFADFAKAIIADVGESFRPYLASAYMGAKYLPGSEKYRAEMDSEAEIEKYLAGSKPAAEPAKQPEPEIATIPGPKGESFEVIHSGKYTKVVKGHFPSNNPKAQGFTVVSRSPQTENYTVSEAWLSGRESAIEKAKELDKEIGAPHKAESATVAEVAVELLPYARTLLTKKSDNVQLDAAIKDIGIDPKIFSRKKAQEALEGAIMRLIREENLFGNFEKLKAIYENMPNLNERTGGSMTRQAYSTPHILSDLLTESLNLGNNDNLTVYEPTAGNGLLLSGVVDQDGTDNTYYLNELDKDRNDMLKSLFPEATISNEDATKTKGPDIKVDLVMANPPFGSIGIKTVYPIQGDKTDIDLTKLEHLIAWESLTHMRPDGKAVLILGAEKENKITGARTVFAKAMYNQFNITGHFELDGQFYKKMGAEWPIEVYIIDGIKDFSLGKGFIKPPTSVRRISYEENWIGVKNYLEGNVKPGKYINRASEPDSGRGPGDNAGKPQRDIVIPDSKRSGEGDKETTGAGRNSESVPAESAVKPEGRPMEDSAGDNGTRRDSERVERVKRTLADEGKTEQRQPRDTTAPDAIESGKHDSGINTSELGVADSLQASYVPMSEGFNFKSLIPKNLENPTRESLKSILEQSGEKTLNDYVAKQLGYKSGKDIPFLAGEQVDALAQCFHSLAQNGGNIIADQTGVGKGRIAAAVIQWAVKNGKIPVFFTEKEGLFNDIYRDLRAIGQSSLRPFMFNDKAEMTYEDENGEKIVAYKQDPKVFDAVYRRMVSGDFSDFTGPNRKFDYIALTYSQINAAPGTHSGNGKLKIMAFMKAKGLIPVMDESHTAAGAAGNAGQEEGRKKKDEGSNQMENALRIIAPERSDGVVYLSATWAKTPKNVPVYYRAFQQKNLTMDEIQTAFKRGDLAIQEMVVASMAARGRYIRREQSYAGVTWRQNQTEEKSEAAAKESFVADNAMARVRDIVALDGKVSAAMADINIEEIIAEYGIEIPPEFVNGDPTAGSKYASSLDNPGSPFSGIHNYISAFLASVKAERAAERAIEMIKAGQKPVISIQNTNESYLDSLVLSGENKVGDAFGGTYGDLLKVNIDRLRKVTIKHPFKKDSTFSFMLPEEALPPEVIAAIEELKNVIDKTDLADLPFSPIDYVIAKIKKAGFSVGEITGRGKYLDYNDMVDGKPILKNRPGNESSASGKRKTLNGFNSGDLDALIVNSAGATGLSAHSSIDFKDQRQRTMLILQPFDDINVFTQMLGRIHRNGAIYNESDVISRIEGKPAKYGWPQYEYLQSSLGMEERPAARLQAKMKSLNANTSSNKQGRQSISEIDVLNKYGSVVMRNWLHANRDYAELMGYDPDNLDSAKAGQITGRLAILPQQVQNSFWDDVTNDYKDLIEVLNSLNANDLEVPSYDKADAVTTKKQLVYGKEGSVDTPPIYAEVIEMTVTGKPTSYEAAMKRTETGKAPSDSDIKERDEAFERYIKLKEQERKDFQERTGRESSINIKKIKESAEDVKKTLLEKYRIGNHIDGYLQAEEVDPAYYLGVITGVKLVPVPENYVGNPWLYSKMKITMASPNATGQLILPANLLHNWAVKKPHQIEAFKKEWQEKFNASQTQRVRKRSLTGDILKAATMSENSRVVQMQRRDGTQEFMWLADTSWGDMRVLKPVEKLTGEKLDNPPSIIVSMDASADITIADYAPTEIKYPAQPKSKWQPVGDSEAKNFEIRVRYSSPFRNLIMADEKLAEILDPVKKDPFVKEKIGNGSFMVSKKRIMRKDLPPVLKRITQILETKSSGLTDGGASSREIDLDKVEKLPQLGKRGSNEILNLVANYTAEKTFSLLESAYNFIIRGSGSMIEWIKNIAADVRRFATQAWKDARKIISLSGRSGLGKRGGIVSLREIIKSSQESLAIVSEEKTRPVPAGAVEELVTETAITAYEIGEASATATAKKRAATAKKYADARLQEKKDMLAKIRKLGKLSYESRTYLVKLASKLPTKERGSLVRAIATANTPLQVGKVIDRIDEIGRAVVRRKAMKRFQEALSKAKKLRPEFQQIVNEIKTAGNKSWYAYESISGILKYLADEEAVYIPGEAIEAMKALQLNQPKSLATDTINMISETLETMAHLSNIENEQIFAQKTKTLMQAAKEIKEHIPTEKALVDESGEMGKFNWYLNIGSMQYEAASEMLGETGRKLFYDDMRDGEREAKRLWFEGRDSLHAAMKSRGFNPEDAKTLAWLEEKQDVYGVAMTRDEKMNLAASVRDYGTAEEIAKAGIKIESSDKTAMFTMEELSELEKFLSNEEKALVSAMRRFVNGKLRTRINETWVELGGYEKALRTDYWPRRRESQKTGFNEGFRQWTKTALEELGIFKERSTSKSPVIIGGATKVYNNHLKKSATFAGFGVPVRNIELAMGKGGLSVAIEKHFGKKFVERIEDQIQAVTDLGNPGEGELNRMLGGVLQNISVGFLGFNPRSALKQFGGLFTAATEIDASLLAASLASAFDKATTKEMYAYSPILRDRYDSPGAALVTPTFNTGKSIAGETRKQMIQRWAMKLLEMFDRAISQIIWAAAKMEIKAKNPNLSGDALLKAVARRAESIVSRTQNVTSILDMSGIAIESRKNTALKALTMFQSQGNSIFNIIRRAMRNYKRGNISAGNLVGIVSLATLGNAVWSSMIGNLVSGKTLAALLRGSGDDEDKDLAKMFLGSELAFDIIRENMGMFYFGNLASPFVNGIRRISDKDKVFLGSEKLENPVESVLNNSLQGLLHVAGGLAKGAEKLKSGPNKGKFKSDAEYERAAVKLFRGLMPLTGMPGLIPAAEIYKFMYSK